MSSKPWLSSYPKGVPECVNPAQYRSIAEMIRNSCNVHARRPAFTSMGHTITYEEYGELSRSLCAYFQNIAGLARGDRIALMMPNILQYPIALYAALRAGLIVVNVNPLYTARELEHQLVDSGARAIIVLENFAGTLQKVIAKTQVAHVIVTGVGDQLSWPRSSLVNLVVRHVRKQVAPYDLPNAVSYNDAIQRGHYSACQLPDLDHEDVAFLQYTGGTTGVAKGAMLTQRNIIANAIQSKVWLDSAAGDGQDILITALPIYHVFALTCCWLVALCSGAHNVLIANPRDLPSFIADLRKHRFTHIYGVNTLFNALLCEPDFRSVDFSTLRVTIGGGMAVQRSVAEHWKRVTGNRLTQAWGLTETSPAACINPFSEEFNESIGLPLPSTEISIRDETGNDLGLNTVGEICVRGPQVMRGYWNRPDETEQVMLGDWLRTGDLGRIDDKGYVYIEDRKKDVILVSGFNVYPNEVEAVISSHPGVLEVAAVAHPDAHSGEVVALFVVKKDPELTANALVEFSRTHLTGYKVPRRVYFRSELPKSSVGKVLRRSLREQNRA